MHVLVLFASGWCYSAHNTRTQYSSKFGTNNFAFILYFNTFQITHL